MSIFLAIHITPDIIEGRSQPDLAVIIVYDIRSGKKKRTINVPTGMNCTEYTSLSFSNDGKYLVALATAGQTTYLLNWSWTRGRLQHAQPLDAAHALTVSYSPFSPTLLVVSGPRCLLYFEADPNQKNLTVLPPTNLDNTHDAYTTHAWVGGKKVSK